MAAVVNADGCITEDVLVARAIAMVAHYGQTDKGGQPYIEHPRAVARATRHCTDDEHSWQTLTTVGWLHDVVEDTQVTLDLLRQIGFQDEVIDAVDALTRRDAETYRQFIWRVATNPIATKVKLCDLAHNLDDRRAGSITPRQRERYLLAQHVLRAAK